MFEVRYTVEDPEDVTQNGELVVEFGNASNKSKIERLSHLLCSIYMTLIQANEVDLAAAYRIHCLSEEIQEYIVELAKDRGEGDADGTTSTCATECEQCGKVD